MKTVFCTPSYTKPHPAYFEAMEKAVPLLDEAGLDHAFVPEIGNAYISAARATMLRKALDAGADQIIFIDHDMSWKPEDLLALVLAEGDVVGGTYLFKNDDEEYMGKPIVDKDGKPCNGRIDKNGIFMIQAACIPAGFLKVTADAVDKFMTAYPELCYGPKHHPCVDLFNHGAFKGLWWGEDYAFCRNWNDAGGTVWLIPDLDLTHHSATNAYPGNYHQFLMRCPGGANNKGKTDG
jgi:glycosyltransferase involved in cell wall biosynthesis